MKNVDDIKFNTQEELYTRIAPALMSKKKMLKLSGFTSVKEIDIWDYMRFNKWNKAYGLELCDMVSDILNTDNNLIVRYYHNKYMPKYDVVEDDFELPKLKS